jgi:hypothetical protein
VAYAEDAGALTQKVWNDIRDLISKEAGLSVDEIKVVPIITIEAEGTMQHFYGFAIPSSPTGKNWLCFEIIPIQKYGGGDTVYSWLDTEIYTHTGKSGEKKRLKRNDYTYLSPQGDIICFLLKE